MTSRASDLASKVVGPSIVQAISQKGLYNALLATMLGTSVFNSFVQGPLSFKTLPRQQFGNLQVRGALSLKLNIADIRHIEQSVLFSYYFSIQTGGSAALMWLWSRSSAFGRVLDRKLISTMFLASSLNLILVGPWTTSIMKRRHRLERLEGTTYNQTDRPVGCWSLS